MSETSTQAEAIIVGAGIIGIACAHYLHKAGYRVTVIDQNALGSGCSSGNCGHIVPSHVVPLNEPGAIMVGLKSLFDANAAFRIKPQLSLSLARWLWEFSIRCTKKQMLRAADNAKPLLDSSMQEFRAIVSELDCDWQEKGLLYVLQTEAGLQSFAKMDQMLTEHFDVSARQLSGDELLKLDPAYNSGLAGAFHYEGDAHLNPDTFISEWSNALKHSGVSFIEHCELISVTKSNGQIDHLNTSKGQLKADHYVIAVGAWSKKLVQTLNCSMPVQPGKGYSVTMKSPEICPSHPAFFPEHRIGVTPFKDSYRLGSMMEFAGFNASIPERRIRQLKELAKPYLQEPYTNQENKSWQGWRPMTWDSLPIIGRTPNLDNTFIATGHNMLGVTMAPGTGKLICELIQGQSTHIDHTPFSPNRF